MRIFFANKNTSLYKSQRQMSSALGSPLLSCLPPLLLLLILGNPAFRHGEHTPGEVLKHLILFPVLPLRLIFRGDSTNKRYSFACFRFSLSTFPFGAVRIVRTADI